MTANRDTLTTVLGGIGAVLTAAQPVIATTQGTHIDSKGIIQIVLAAVFALFGFFTNRDAAK